MKATIAENKRSNQELDNNITIGSGSGYSVYNSEVNIEEGARGIPMADRDSILFRITVSGTMPIGTEVLLTPYYIGFET